MGLLYFRWRFVCSTAAEDTYSKRSRTCFRHTFWPAPWAIISRWSCTTDSAATSTAATRNFTSRTLAAVSSIAKAIFVVTIWIESRVRWSNSISTRRLFGISENCKSERCYKQLNVMLTKQPGVQHHMVIDDMLLMVFQMIALHVILEIFEQKNRRKWNDHSASPAEDDDVVEPEVVGPEVVEEKRRVDEYMKRKVYDRRKNGIYPTLWHVSHNVAKITSSMCASSFSTETFHFVSRFPPFV